MKNNNKRKNWLVTFYDNGKQFGPVQVSKCFPITEVEAALYALREANKPHGFSLNVKFVATPGRMKK